MKPGYILLLLFLLVLSIVTIIGQFFIFESEDNVHLNNASKVSMQLKHLDLELNEKILLIAAFKSIHFDDIAKTTSNIKHELKKLKNIAIPYPSDEIKKTIESLITLLNKSLNIKIVQVEDLKSHSAITRNSTNYLLKELNKPIFEEHTKLADIASATFIDIQGFQIFPTSERRNVLLQKLNSFKAVVEQAKDDSYYKNIVLHMDKSFLSMQKIVEIQQLFFNLNNQNTIEALIANINNIHLSRQNKATQNQFILVVIAIVILIVAALMEVYLTPILF